MKGIRIDHYEPGGQPSTTKLNRLRWGIILAWKLIIFVLLGVLGNGAQICSLKAFKTLVIF